MKRSTRISLVLLGGIATGALTACAPDDAASTRISSESVYTNDTFIPGVGYYHAPFRAFYPRRYNDYDANTRRYYFGGRWETAPDLSVINISSPTPEVARAAETARNAQIERGGFGGTSRRHSIWS